MSTSKVLDQKLDHQKDKKDLIRAETKLPLLTVKRWKQSVKEFMQRSTGLWR